MSSARRARAFRVCARIVAATAFALAAGLPALAGGPLDVVNQQPVVYANGGTSLTLNVDQGPLGSRTNAQARALMQAAIGLWNGVGTSTLRLAIGTPLPVDYTSTNYTTVHDNYTDGVNPVIFDTDGSITDLIFGAGAKASVLGFAGSAYWNTGPSAGNYIEGEAVLNGSISIPDATWTVVFAHEIGHYFGLDHAQLDSSQGLASGNYVLMYPIAYRSLLSLHEDDAAAVTALYPAASAATAYGQISGTFTTAGGTPILGANIWAKESTTLKVYSVVSDYLMQGTCYFRLYRPPGIYTLHAESIDARFTSGSGVGPYSGTSAGLSFQAPHPITPVALGASQPQAVTIVAGCAATATFRLDGTGGVGGNCSQPSPAATTTALASSANPALAGATVLLTATVTGNAPTGTVRFAEGATALAGCATVALAGSGNVHTATCSTGSLAAGPHNLVATYGGDAGNLASGSTTLAQAINTTPAPALTGAVSRKVHGAAGTFDLPLSLASGNPTTEPRISPTVTVVVTFDQPVASAAVALTEGSATLGGVVAAGNTATVTLSNVANAQYLTIGLINVTGTSGNSGGTGSVRIGFLGGDINGNRSVTLSDLMAVNGMLSQDVAASNYRMDVNASGTISLADKLGVATNLTLTLPAP